MSTVFNIIITLNFINQSDLLQLKQSLKVFQPQEVVKVC